MGGHRFLPGDHQVHVLNLIDDRAAGYQLTDFRDSANSDRETLEELMIARRRSCDADGIASST